MLFLFRGHNGPAARAAIGTIVLAVALILHHEALLAAIGVVLIVWGAIGVLQSQKARRPDHFAEGGQVS